MNFFQKNVRNHPLLSFVILAFSITWIGSSIYHFSFQERYIELPAIFALLSSFIWYYGPCLAALIVSRITKGSLGIRHLFQKMIQWRVKWSSYLFIILYPVALHLFVVGLDYLINGTRITFFKAEGVPQGNVIVILLGLIVLQIFQRGIGEETGWRGFALPELRSNHSILISNLILGMIWAVWHFHPANFNVLISIEGIFVFFNIFLTTFLFTWLYNHTNGSLMMAILFHMLLNILEYIIPIGITETSLPRHFLRIGFILLTVVGIYVINFIGEDERIRIH